jgi:two-component system, NarL family, nitrate/nitrite response regulator NarL
MSESLKPNKIRVLLVDDHPMTLAGIKTYLSEKKGIEIIGEAYNGKEAVELAKALSPDVVLMDISMPILDGIQAARILKKESPQAKVLFLTMHDNKEYFEEFLNSGGRGYILKNASPEELIFAIESVHDGKAYFNPTHSQILLEDYEKKHDRSPKKLTNRESTILILIAKGHTNKQIAEKLCSSHRTIEKHRNKIMEKLDLHTAVDLTRYAISQRLIESTE